MTVGPGPLRADPFAGQAASADALAELYDLEHDRFAADQSFYRELTRRVRGPVLDLGCGSGRLFGAYLDGGASRVVGVDASAAMLRRARARIAADQRLAAAAAEGRIDLVAADATAIRRAEHFGLIVAAGVMPHLDGPEDASRLLDRAFRLLKPRALLVIDDLGPASLPTADAPLALDWTVEDRGRRITRRSQVVRRAAPEGLRVVLSTVVDVQDPDGTIARLPASFRLWYPFPDVLARLVEAAGLVIATTYGSHDLDPFGADSERHIVLCRRVRHRTAPRAVEHG